MSIIETFLIAIALSMDAFAVSICKGLSMKKLNLKIAALIALFFGSFQAIMPLIGWLLGTQFEKYITDFDHWIAFFLLALIGANMIKESRELACKVDKSPYKVDIKKLFILAIATSIDALAAGITFAVVPDTNIILSILLIGLTTLVLSFIGVGLGNRFGAKYKSKAELAGGIVLIGIGLKILLEHLGIISF